MGFLKHLFRALVITLLAFFVVALGHFGDFLDVQNKNLSHLLYKERPLHPDIVIVGIDDRTLAEQAQGGLGNLGEWNSKTYARTFENILAGQPRSLMLDILFNTPSSSIQKRDIAEILQENTDVEDFTLEILSFLAAEHPFDQQLANVFASFEEIYLIKAATGEQGVVDGKLQFTDSIEPMDLYKAVTQQGFANVSTSEASSNTSTIYSIPAYFEVQGVVEPHMDLKLAFQSLGGDLPLPVEDGQMLVNYSNPAYSYPIVSFSDVYYGRVDPTTFTNKIVLVGHTSFILQDRAFTPIDQNVPMPGVEIHANAVQTILEGAFLSHQDALSFVGVFLLVSLLSTFAFLHLPILVAAGLFLLEIVLFPFYAQWSFKGGVILDLIWPIVGLLISFLVTLAYRYATEFREKRKLRQAFGHYVSSDLVTEISEHPEMLKLGGERRNLSILFLDIENFTTLSETLEPQEVVALVNTYFDALAEVVLQHGGMVDKFEGDAIMALFGAPLPSTDHALKACAAALEMRVIMQSLNKQAGRNLNIRIGLATGEAILGNMGSKRRFDYTAMGDIVNTASRLEGGNKFYGTQILVHQATMLATQNIFAYRKIDEVRFKGKKEAIAVYELLGDPAGVTAELQELLQRWGEALIFYKEGAWEKAEGLMRSVLEKIPQDGPCAAYLERIADLQKNPPLGWDGTWTFGKK